MKNGLSVNIFEPFRYENGYFFSYLIEYWIGFEYRVLNSNLKIDRTILDPNPIHCHPYSMDLNKHYISAARNNATLFTN